MRPQRLRESDSKTACEEVLGGELCTVRGEACACVLWGRQALVPRRMRLGAALRERRPRAVGARAEGRLCLPRWIS
jgi:hypothetical protein